MFDPYHKWLGIPRDRRPPTFYQLLAIAPTEDDAEVIDAASVRQSTYLRNFQRGPHAAECARILGEVALARATLLDPAKRRAYDATLPRRDKGREATAGRVARWSVVVGLAVVGLVAFGIAVIRSIPWRGHPPNGRDEHVARSDASRAPSPARVNEGHAKVVEPERPRPTPTSRVTPADNSALRPAEIVTSRATGMKLRLIPAGAFDMGSDDSDKDAKDDEKVKVGGQGRKHCVRITRPFYLGVTEVTQGQYRAVTGESPSIFKGWDDLPVECVSWFDAVKFCNALSTKEGLAPFYQFAGDEVNVLDWNGAGYRLPTEAEWEYACRAGPGGAGAYSFGDAAAQLGRYAWFDNNSSFETHPVGQKALNAFGLYDMHGNVWEWCWDGHAPYAAAPAVDPTGPPKASDRVSRGGSWNNSPGLARSANRNWDAPGDRDLSLGFRVARTLPEGGDVVASVDAAGVPSRPRGEAPPKAIEVERRAPLVTKRLNSDDAIRTPVSRPKDSRGAPTTEEAATKSAGGDRNGVSKPRERQAPIPTRGKEDEPVVDLDPESSESRRGDRAQPRVPVREASEGRRVEAKSPESGLDINQDGFVHGIIDRPVDLKAPKVGLEPPNGNKEKHRKEPPFVVAHWRFEEGKPDSPATGERSILDSSGNGLHGTPINGPVYRLLGKDGAAIKAGAIGKYALDFNGIDQRILISDDPRLQLTQSLTVEAVICVSRQKMRHGKPIVFRGDDRGGLDPFILILHEDGELGFGVCDGDGNGAEVNHPIPGYNRWFHVAGTLDGDSGAMKLYFDGKLVESTTTRVRPFGPLDASWRRGVAIGSLQTSSPAVFEGLIAEVRISNRALGPGQLLGNPFEGRAVASPDEVRLWSHLDISDAKVMDGFLRIEPGKFIATRAPYTGPIDVYAVARTANQNIRLHAFNGAGVIFNWEVNPRELRVSRPDGGGRPESGSVATAAIRPLKPGQWYKLHWRLTKDSILVSIDEKIVFKEKGNYKLGFPNTVKLSTVNDPVDVKSFVIKAAK